MDDFVDIGIRKRKQTQLFTTQPEIDRYLDDPTSRGAKAAAAKEKESAGPRVAKEKEARDPKLWGSHSRDRFLRSLLHFGFGRWERVKVISSLLFSFSLCYVNMSL